jgi:hypothetical protein
MERRELKPKPLYSVDPHENGEAFTYLVTKMDFDLNVLEKYKVYYPLTQNEDGGKYGHCDCFAGLMGKFCRHKQVVDIFRAEGAIGKPRLYNFDRKKWADR